MFKKGFLLCAFSLFMTACSVSPKPDSIDDRFAEAKRDLAAMNQAGSGLGKNLDFYQALARGLKYNLDYRIKIANDALQMGQLKLAEYAMLPAVNTSYSTYSRNNDLSSSSTTASGQVSDISNSTPRVLQSQRVGISWAAIDFGLGYVRAQQQADRYLVAREEARRQLQQLSQDILTAYWEAYSAQELVVQATAFQTELNTAKEKLEAAIKDKTVPKENILNYEEALLDGQRALLQLKFKYDKAMYDLKHLLNLPLEATFKLTKPPGLLYRMPDLKNLDFKKLDAITLVSRPELWGQHYQEKIAQMGIRIAILQALPGITLNEGWNYNSNKFLLNPIWTDRSADIAWNLLNIVSLPASLHSAEDQVKYEKMKLMALTLGVLTETRYAYSHYQNLRDEYQVATQQAENTKMIYRITKDKESASLASTQQVIIAKIHVLTRIMDNNLMIADISKAMGELYLSVGFDMLPIGIDTMPLPAIVDTLKKGFAMQEKMSFEQYVDFIHSKLFEQKRSSNLEKNTALAQLPQPWQSAELDTSHSTHTG